VRRALVRMLATTAGLWLADQLLPRLALDGVGPLLAAALLLSLVHAMLRPILVFLTLPITLLTLGLFLWLLNALLLGAVAFLVPGFRIDGILPALAGSAVVSLAGTLATAVTRPRPAR
jgi:putative membrane protein